jgi:hypothetical protein
MSAALFAGALTKDFSALDTSGKSAAWRHHRKDCIARRRPAAGFSFDLTLAQGCFHSSNAPLKFTRNWFMNWKGIGVAPRAADSIRWPGTPIELGCGLISKIPKLTLDPSGKSGL